MHTLSVLMFLLASCALALQPGCLLAAEVFKCVVNGKTVYQDGPCRGQGAALDIKAEASPEPQQEAISRAHKDRLNSSSSRLATSQSSRSTPPAKGGASSKAMEADAVATQKAIADCEAQRGIDCKDPATIEDFRWKNTPMTPEQQQRAARTRTQDKKRQDEEELRRRSPSP